MKINFFLKLIIALIILGCINLVVGYITDSADNKSREVSRGDKKINICQRKEPYSAPDSINKSLELISKILYKSLSEKYPEDYFKGSDQAKSNIIEKEPSYVILSNFLMVRNCLNIQFASKESLGGGDSAFDISRNSTSQKLNIYISEDYKINSNAVLTTLIVHEVSHAIDFFYKYPKYTMTQEECYQTEIKAYDYQLVFFALLDEHDKERVMEGIKREPNKEYIGFLDLVNRIFVNKEDISLKKYIRSNEYYKQQCLKY